MKEIDQMRGAVKRYVVGEGLGISAEFTRAFQIEIATATQVAAILSLPVDVTHQRPLQNANGNPILLYGVSPYGVSAYGGATPRTLP